METVYHIGSICGIISLAFIVLVVGFLLLAGWATSSSETVDMEEHY